MLSIGVGERGVGGGEEQDTVAGRGGQVRHDLDYLDQVEEDPQLAGGGGPGVACAMRAAHFSSNRAARSSRG